MPGLDSGMKGWVRPGSGGWNAVCAQNMDRE